MRLHDIAIDVRNDLEQRGLRFTRVRDADTGLSFELPRGWVVERSTDGTCLTATHGSPPEGVLVLGRPRGSRRGQDPVLDFLEPHLATTPGETLEVSEPRALETEETVHILEFETARGAERRSGQAISVAVPGGMIVAAYATGKALYHPGLVRKLLLLVLDSATAKPAASTRGGAQAALDILEPAFWQEPLEQATIPFEPPGERFALKLPEDWRGLEVSDENGAGWLLVPEGHPPGKAGTLVTISAADLVTDLDTTMHEALEALLDAGIYSPSTAPRHVDIAGRTAVLQVYHGVPPGAAEGAIHAVWSLGVTDDITVAHLFAVMPWTRLRVLLPPLNAIGRSLRLLPRSQNLELMTRFNGFWRYLDTHEEVDEVAERCFHFRPDGSFAFVQRRVNRIEAIHSPPHPSDLDMDTAGQWDIVGTTLTMLRHDGTREVLDITAVSTRTAIVDRVIWERLLEM